MRQPTILRAAGRQGAAATQCLRGYGGSMEHSRPYLASVVQRTAASEARQTHPNVPRDRRRLREPLVVSTGGRSLIETADHPPGGGDHGGVNLRMIRGTAAPWSTADPTRLCGLEVAPQFIFIIRRVQ